MLRPLVAAVGLSLGAASSVLPKKAASAISGGEFFPFLVQLL